MSFRAKKAVKDEKKDQTAPIVLNNIANTSSDSDSEPEGTQSGYMSYSQHTIQRNNACIQLSLDYLNPDHPNSRLSDERFGQNS